MLKAVHTQLLAAQATQDKASLNAPTIYNWSTKDQPYHLSPFHILKNNTYK